MQLLISHCEAHFTPFSTCIPDIVIPIPTNNFKNDLISIWSFSCQYGDRCKFLHVTHQQSKPHPFGFGRQNTVSTYDSISFWSFSCQYGDRCKFLHVTQEQSKPHPFGSQNTSQFQHATQQQQKPNPFGFGVQSGSQLKGPSSFDAKYNSQSQPFENTWSRSSSITSLNSRPYEQTDKQPQTAIHKCTDPETCKHQIVEDLKQERPLWKLTCYGHCRNCPCDIFGDISYEELRLAAYEDARQGLTLQSIVERERNLLNSKLIEFNNLLRNPYIISQYSCTSGACPSPAVNHNASSVGIQNNAPISVSSFSQLGASTNLISNIRSPAPSGSGFGHTSHFQTPSQTSTGIEMKFGSAVDGQLLNNSLGPNFSNFNNGIVASQSNPISLPPAPFPQIPSNATSQSFGFLGLTAAADTVNKYPIGACSTDSKRDATSGDNSIWLREEWEIGEIPEEEPPDAFC